MTAVPILLADAVARVLNTAVADDAFETTGFTARRSYPDWDQDYKDLKDLAVDVVYVSSGGNETAELDSFDSLETEPAVDIAVRYRFGSSDRETNGGRLKNASIDPLVKLVEQIHERLAADRQTPLSLATGIHANWIEAKVRTYCNYRRLREGLFEGVVRVEFTVSKAGA